MRQCNRAMRALIQGLAAYMPAFCPGVQGTMAQARGQWARKGERGALLTGQSLRIIMEVGSLMGRKCPVLRCAGRHGRNGMIPASPIAIFATDVIWTRRTIEWRAPMTLGDRPIVARRSGCGCLIEPVVEDRPCRSIGACIDIERTAAGRFDPFTAEALHQAHDAQAGPEALSGMRAIGQDVLAEQCRTGADGGGFLGDAFDRPVGEAPIR